ncbi:large ribosomal subunit protein bL12m [Prorops nasuta]|uniref:large ribosomal subunit protein bL12m n=1 Tax=Prorops nasuta TaxID=863751 RepID=UPI0034CEA0D5
MYSLRLAARRNFSQLRHLHKCGAVCQTATESAKVEPLPVPPPTGVDRPVNPKIDKIAKDITALNLIEVAELSDLLKKRLNLPDAPIMPMGGFAALPKEEKVEEEVKVKTDFTVKLVKFDVNQKVALIKEIKNILPEMNLVQAKKFVEAVPTIVKAEIPKAEADKIVEIIQKVGGEVEIL